jgi:arylsulfatase A-like enzyme
LAAAGLDVPKDRKIDGVNLVPYVEGKASGRPHPYLFWRAFGGTYLAVRDAQYKLVRIEGKPDELYDLEQDISEEKNVIASQPAAYKRLAAAMEGWNKELVKPLWLDHIQDRDKLGGKKE